VFNADGNEGFVIVSGDERTPAILGYSDSGTFDYDNLPENAKAWIDGYAEQIKSIDKQDGEGRARAANPKLTKEVAPLLGGTVWNQESPFNWLSPKGPPGCTATAMAQIMYYHQWPQNHGSGSISYKWNGTTLSADFSKSNYEWNLMRENYNNTYSEEEGNAVALLIRDCGYSVKTNYRDDGSSGYSNLVGPSLVKYFDYKDSYATIKRQYFDTESWEGILRTELDNKRPIFYTGTGHAFVCDGYDKDGLFHFNWGWGGLYNGYFVSCAIEWSDQEITCGIQKSSDSGEILLIPYSTKDFSWSSGNRFSCGLAFSTRAKNIELALE